MTHKHTTDEFLDLVDDNDNIIGRKKRSEVYSEHLSNFRVINAFLINSSRKLWIPRRTAGKRIFPLCLDMSLGGHVESGETYEDAFRRELEEELGLEIESVNFKELGKLAPKEHDVSAFMKVYEIESDETPDFNKNDFTEYFWLSPQNVLQKISNGDKCKDDLPKLIKIFYLAT